MVKKRAPRKVLTRYEIEDLLVRLERAGFTNITTQHHAIYFDDATGQRNCFPYVHVDAGRGCDYLVAGPGTGSKLDAAYEAGAGIIGEYTLVRLLGVYKEHPLHEDEA